VPGHRWISLRLDGSGFSSLTRSRNLQSVPTNDNRKFRRLGIFGQGHCPKFAKIMQVHMYYVIVLTLLGVLSESYDDLQCVTRSVKWSVTIFTVHKVTLNRMR